MPQVLSPTKYILKAGDQFKCQVPLSSLEKCQYKYCKQNANNEIDEPHNMHLAEHDEYWSEFLKAQRHSSANYIYKIQTFGSAQDPTLVKKEPVPTDTINQRLLNMRCIGGLLKIDLFYLLSILLNLMELPVQMQKEYLEHMLNRKALDMEIINYLQLVSRHPSAGLTENQLKEFQQILQILMAKNTAKNKVNYYNSEHIFLKSPNDINPYEQEYLRRILHSNRKLTAQQTMYLAKLVYKLQELDNSTREEYLGFLRQQHILPFNSFEYLIIFLVTRAKRINGNKLKILLKELQILMDIGPCEPAEPEKFAIEIKMRRKKEIEIDYLRIDNAFNHLMKCVIPNIVRLKDLKNFLQNMMILNEDQVKKVLNSLKIAKVMTKQRFHFVQHFIEAGKLGKLDKSKKRQFIELLKNVAESTVNKEIMVNLDIPASKGPIKEQPYNKDISATQPIEEARNSFIESDKKEEEETNERDSKNEIDNKKSKMAKRLKKPLKKKAKKAGKKNK